LVSAWKTIFLADCFLLFSFFVSGNHPVEWLHFGMIQVVEPVIFTHWHSLKWNFTLVSERGISPSTTDDSKLISDLLV